MDSFEQRLQNLSVSEYSVKNSRPTSQMELKWPTEQNNNEMAPNAGPIKELKDKRPPREDIYYKQEQQSVKTPKDSLTPNQTHEKQSPAEAIQQKSDGSSGQALEDDAQPLASKRRANKRRNKNERKASNVTKKNAEITILDQSAKVEQENDNIVESPMQSENGQAPTQNQQNDGSNACFENLPALENDQQKSRNHFPKVEYSVNTEGSAAARPEPNVSKMTLESAEQNSIRIEEKDIQHIEANQDQQSNLYLKRSPVEASAAPENFYQQRQQLSVPQLYQQSIRNPTIGTPSSKKAGYADKSDVITYRDPNTINSMDEMLSSLSETTTNQGRCSNMKARRPVTPDPQYCEEADQNRFPTYDGMENFEQSDDSSTPGHRDIHCPEQQLNVNLQKYHIDNDRLIRFPNDQKLKVSGLANRNQTLNKFKFHDDEEDEGDDEEESSECNYNGDAIHTIEEIDERFEVESTPCNTVGNGPNLNRELGGMIKQKGQSRLSPQNNLVQKQSASTGPTDVYQSHAPSPSTPTKHIRKSSHHLQQVKYFGTGEIDNLTDKNDITQGSPEEAIKNQQHYANLSKQLQQLSKQLQDSQNLYFQAKVPTFEKNDNDNSDSNQFLESQEAAYLRECLKDQHLEVEQIRMFQQSLELKHQTGKDKKSATGHNIVQLEQLEQLSKPQLQNTFSNTFGQDFSNINVSIPKKDTAKSKFGFFQCTPGPFKWQCISACLPPVAQPAPNDSSISISHLNQNPYSDKSLEFNIKDIDDDHKHMMDHEAAPPLPTPFDHSRSSNNIMQDPPQPPPTLNQSHQVKSSNSSYIMVNYSTNTQKYHINSIRMGFKESGEGTPHGGTQVTSNKDSKRGANGGRRKKIATGSPQMLGRFKMIEANESDEKTEITFLNNLNPEVASLLYSQQSPQSLNSQFRGHEKALSYHQQYQQFEKNKKMKKAKKDQIGKIPNKVVKPFMPAKMQPSQVYMLNPKTLEQSTDFEMYDEDLYSIDSNGEKKVSFRSAGKMKASVRQYSPQIHQAISSCTLSNLTALQNNLNDKANTMTQRPNNADSQDKIENQESQRQEMQRSVQSPPSLPDQYLTCTAVTPVMNMSRTETTSKGENRAIRSCNVSRRHGARNQGFDATKLEHEEQTLLSSARERKAAPLKSKLYNKSPSNADLTQKNLKVIQLLEDYKKDATEEAIQMKEKPVSNRQRAKLNYQKLLEKNQSMLSASNKDHSRKKSGSEMSGSSLKQSMIKTKASDQQPKMNETQLKELKQNQEEYHERNNSHLKYSKSDPHTKNKFNKLVHHVPVREVKLPGVLATARVNTPSTPDQNSQSQITLGNPAVIDVASSSKSFYERLSDLNDGEHPSNIFVQISHDAGPRNCKPNPDNVPSCSPYVAKGGVVLQNSLEEEQHSNLNTLTINFDDNRVEEVEIKLQTSAKNETKPPLKDVKKNKFRQGSQSSENQGSNTFNHNLSHSKSQQSNLNNKPVSASYNSSMIGLNKQSSQKYLMNSRIHQNASRTRQSNPHPQGFWTRNSSKDKSTSLVKSPQYDSRKRLRTRKGDYQSQQLHSKGSSNSSLNRASRRRVIINEYQTGLDYCGKLIKGQEQEQEKKVVKGQRR